VQTATEFLTFNGYVGPASTDADGGAPAAVNRIDVQHFDAATSKSKGHATPLLTAAGDGSGLYINGAAIAPTGEIAIIYSARSPGAWGVYLVFLSKDLTVNQTTQLVALGSDSYQDQSYVQWIGGKFVASAVVGANPVTIKVVKYGADGANAGGISAIPTDDPSGHVRWWNAGEGEVASSCRTSALSMPRASRWAAPLLCHRHSITPTSIRMALLLPARRKDSWPSILGPLPQAQIHC